MGNLEKLTDIEIAVGWANHIKNPCSTQIGDKRYDIREFYLIEAKIILPIFKNPYARDFLESVIKEYS